MKLWLCVAAACAALVFPASAVAIRCAPPGNAGVDQYFETVPGSSCNRPSNGPGSGPGGGSPGSLQPGTRRQLAAQGPVGQAVARLVSSNGTNGTGSRSGASNGTGAGLALTASGSGPLSGLLNPVVSGSSSDGVGILLPVFLITVLVLALGTVAFRRTRGSAGSGPE